MIDDCMSDFSTIYNDPRFRRGFALITDKSNEKETIASFLTQKIKLLLGDRDKVEIIDLAGGSGSIWRRVAENLLKQGIKPDSVLNLTLVDSSEDQVNQARSLNLSFMEVKQDDGTSYLKTVKDKVDLITCIHFLPGLPKDLQKEIFEDSKKILTTGGYWISVQPNIENPLTHAKINLRKKILDIDYKTNYLTTDDLSGEDIKIETFASYLYVKKEELKDLGYFLLGEANRDLSSDEEDIIESTLEEISVGSPSLEIKLINDYLVWRNND